MATDARIRRVIPTEDYIIPPHTWQAYGYYADTGEVWAGAVRASNEYMARDAQLSKCWPLNPVITRIHVIDVYERPQSDRKRFRRDNPDLCRKAA